MGKTRYSRGGKLITDYSEHGWEYADVDFKAELSESNYCVCDACHQVGDVLKLTLPTTKYTRKGKLTTKYSEYWICSECEEKLMSVLTPSGLEKTSQIYEQEG